MVFISTAHPLMRRGDPLSLLELAGEDVYIPTSYTADASIEYARVMCKSHGFTPRNIVVLPNVNTVPLTANMGLAVAFLDDLITLPINYNLIDLEIDSRIEWVVAWRREIENSQVAELAEMICAEAAFDG